MEFANPTPENCKTAVPIVGVAMEFVNRRMGRHADVARIVPALIPNSAEAIDVLIAAAMGPAKRNTMRIA
jgi:hypothetical protein